LSFHKEYLEVLSAENLKQWYIAAGGNKAALENFATDAEHIQDMSKYWSGMLFLIPNYTAWALYMDPISNIQAIGQLLYTYHVFHFIVASLILLVAMIGAIVLTQNKSYNTLTQNVFDQNNRDHMLTVSKVRIESTQNL
jgi:hypothetical protein